jgi:PrtD family type I secretion system ABC transporter
MLLPRTSRRGQGPAAAAMRACRGPLIAVAVFSGAINLLMLTGSLFMLQVYDFVLPGRSLPTLAVLLGLASMLYVFQGLLDMLRGRILSRLGNRVDARLSGPVFSALIGSGTGRLPPDLGPQAARDLDQFRQFAAGQGPSALFDLPWTPLYLAIAFGFHPWIGWTALAGVLLLSVIAVAIEMATQGPLRAALASATEHSALSEACRRNAGVITAMGMQGALRARWLVVHARAVEDHRRASDVAGSLGSLARIARLFLQSLVLAMGAWLVLRQDLTAGGMFAASMITARALAPIELAVTQWRSVVAARQSYRRLKDGLPAADESPRIALHTPSRSLAVESLAVRAPGAVRPMLLHAEFALKAGDGLGVIGASASGKSTLLRALAGVWLPERGAVRIDGAPHHQWPPHRLGAAIGYLPQEINLFAGTIAENIARFSPDRDDTKVIAAAREAGIHDMILQMPSGYETRLGDAGTGLSGGQQQGIGLARAIYDDPFLVILDEPNSNLDGSGEAALIRAIASIRARGGIVVVAAHRPSILSSLNVVLVMAEGRQRTFGPTHDVLRRTSQSVPAGNVTDLRLNRNYGEAHA